MNYIKVSLWKFYFLIALLMEDLKTFHKVTPQIYSYENKPPKVVHKHIFHCTTEYSNGLYRFKNVY